MERVLSKDIAKHIGKEIKLSGWIHRIRKIGGLAFVVLRDGTDLVQTVFDKKDTLKAIEDLKEESVVSIVGKVVKEKRAPLGAELKVSKVEIISKVTEDLPITINKKELHLNIDTLLDNRTLALRNPKLRAIFSVQEEILQAFRSFFVEHGFTEINTPKIVCAGAETGGAEMFSLKYFKKGLAYLAQSPQLYKQIMVGVFERVFETAYVYRAEPHATTRHINEYMSLDVEMGFIESWMDLIDIHQELVKYMIDWLSKSSKENFEILGAKIPKYVKIPILRFREAQEIFR